MGQFGVMIGQLVGFLIMLMVGYGCVRLRFYGQTALDGMCSLLLNVLIPVLVFSNAVDGADRAQLAANWGVMLLTAVMYALLILVFWLVAKLLRLKGSRSHVFQASLIFGNAGFIGIPLIMALWPQNGAIYVALMSIIDQTLLWTYGVWLCEPVAETTGGNAIGSRGAVANGSVNGAGSVGNAGSASNAANGGSPAVVRPSPGTRVLGLLKRFVNPAFVGVMLALILILLGVKVPDIILKPLHTIGNMATPMSLIYLGGLFALTKWWGVLKRYELYAGLVAKMIAFPLAFYALLTALTGALPQLPITHDMVLIHGHRRTADHDHHCHVHRSQEQHARVCGRLRARKHAVLAGLPDDCVGSCVLNCPLRRKECRGPPALGISSTPPTTRHPRRPCRISRRYSITRARSIRSIAR